MTLGHLGQFDAIHCDSKTHKVLSNYSLLHLECHFFILKSQLMMYFSKSITFR